MEHCKYQLISILSVQLTAFPAVLNCYVWYSVIQSSRLQHWMIMFVGPRHDQSVDQWPLTRRPATTTLGRRGQTGCQCSLDTHMQVELPGSVFRYIRQSRRISFLSVFQTRQRVVTGHGSYGIDCRSRGPFPMLRRSPGLNSLTWMLNLQ